MLIYTNQDCKTVTAHGPLYTEERNFSSSKLYTFGHIGKQNLHTNLVRTDPEWWQDSEFYDFCMFDDIRPKGLTGPSS